MEHKGTRTAYMYGEKVTLDPYLRPHAQIMQDRSYNNVQVKSLKVPQANMGQCLCEFGADKIFKTPKALTINICKSYLNCKS